MKATRRTNDLYVPGATIIKRLTHSTLTYHHHTNYSFGRINEHRYKKRRNISFHGRYGRNEYIKTKSHSLNAILEELYSFGPENTAEEGGRKINYETGRPLIPRIKLKRSTSSLKEERSYKTLCKMSSESEIFIRRNSTNSSPNITLNNETNDANSKMPDSNISILLNDQSYDEISRKSDENYFAKNFDDCMKRLQLIEKEHELIEKEDADLQFCIIQKGKENVQTSVLEVSEIPSTEPAYNYEIECDSKNSENGCSEVKVTDNGIKTEKECSESVENCLQHNSVSIDTSKATPTKDDGTLDNDTKETTSVSWYSNLKQQFEKKENENNEQKTKEVSCRITGATLKSQNDKNKSDDDKEKDTRHYFSRLVKTNKSLIDEELPDPDKVKHIRAMFQENLNSTLKRKLDKKLGGSLQNISVRAGAEQQMNRPLSAQCYRNDLFCEAGNNQKSEEEKDKRTAAGEISKPSRVDGNGEFQIENTKKKLFEKYEKDLKQGKEYRNRRVLQPKWTDTGSVSSGIGSDLSSYDTDLECYSREGTEQDEMTMSDDDLLEEVKDKHYVQNEVLEKIRSFGTSVTYYGGEMITCSVGPLLSPTTQAIIEEIGEKYGHETSPARSFDEFYRKYIETNEPNRKKKLGRTRSFGQNDVFQKPNVLNNTEIEMYKNDLEIEIGIKKPVGIPQNSLKKKVAKSASLGCNAEAAEKPKENSESPILTSDTLDNFKKETSDPDFGCVGSDIINKDVTEDIANNNTNSNASFQFADEIQNHIGLSEEKDIEPRAGEETQKPTLEKETPFLRSKSVPDGFPSSGKNVSSKCEITYDVEQHPAKEIFFSYEKSLFNGKRKSDMEFEEFEVCESLSEKLEKLEKINSHEKSTESQEISLSTNTEEEIKKPFENKTEEETGVGLTILTAEIPAKEGTIKENRTIDRHFSMPILGGSENTQTEKKESRLNHSRWPIETSVMVDIQKNNEQTPKIITTGKTVAKTKIRLFR